MEDRLLGSTTSVEKAHYLWSRYPDIMRRFSYDCNVFDIHLDNFNLIYSIMMEYLHYGDYQRVEALLVEIALGGWSECRVKPKPQPQP